MEPAQHTAKKTDGHRELGCDAVKQFLIWSHNCPINNLSEPQLHITELSLNFKSSGAVSCLSFLLYCEEVAPCSLCFHFHVGSCIIVVWYLDYFNLPTSVPDFLPAPERISCIWYKISCILNVYVVSGSLASCTCQELPTPRVREGTGGFSHTLGSPLCRWNVINPIPLTWCSSWLFFMASEG